MFDAPLQLFERYPRLERVLPRFPLVARPTPVRPLPALGQRLGLPELWLKDDSGTPPVGGNKARKLEFLVAAAKARGRSTLLTMGYLGTNHGLATTLAAGVAGMDAELVLIEEVSSDHVRDTLLRCAGLGARLHYAPSEVSSAPAVASALGRAWLRGSPPEWIPPGGSSTLGTVGYLEAGLELARQVRRGECPEPHRIYVPLGSAGTAAGIALGIALGGLRSELRAVRVVDPRMASTSRTIRLAAATWRFLRERRAGVDPIPPRVRLRAVAGFEGPGYGTETPEAMAAIRAAREEENLELEVTYTGRALAALAHEVSSVVQTGRPVMLWNTFHPRGPLPHGTPAWQELPSEFHHAFEPDRARR
jgi:D-cysteine desulfhydrase